MTAPGADQETKQALPIPEKLRAPLLAAMLPLVAFEGWTDKVLANSAKAQGIDPGLARLAFPGGIGDVLDYFCLDGDQRMRDALAETDLGDMKIRERIKTCVLARLQAGEPHREAVRRAVSMFALPVYICTGAGALWRTADAIWVLAGDTSTDYNYYSKRGILSGVFSATLLSWLGDDSAGYTDTEIFLENRIENVMQFEKLKARAGEMFRGPPAPCNFPGSFQGTGS